MNGKDSVSVEKVLTLFRCMGKLNAEIDLEQSFKATHGQLSTDRLLLGIQRNESQDAQVCRICQQLGIPGNLLARFKDSLPDANHVYFGIEKDRQTLLLKSYLEYRDKVERLRVGTTATGKSFLLFRGFKWEAQNPTRQAVTRYTWYPSISVPDMLQRLSTLLDSARHKPVLKVFQRIIECATARAAKEDFQFLEVTEDGNPRCSFDINLYKAHLNLDDVSSWLLDATHCFALEAERLEALCQRLKGESLGHLAGGIDRDNRVFMTVYYGVCRIQSAQLASATIVGD